MRLKRHGLGKRQRAQAERGARPPDAELVRRRLEALRRYPWSSHRAYAGLAKGPEWLEMDRVLAQVGSGDAASRRKWFRDYVEGALRSGLPRSPWEELRERVVLGAAAFIQKVKQDTLRAVRGERHRAQRLLENRLGVEELRRAVEAVKGEPWEAFAGRHGDPGRDMFLWLARRHCGSSLRELGAVAGGMSVSAVNQSLRRIGHRMLKDRALAQHMVRVRQKCKVQT